MNSVQKILLGVICFALVTLYACSPSKQDVSPSQTASKVRNNKSLNASLQQSVLFETYVSKLEAFANPLENILNGFSDQQISTYMFEVKVAFNEYESLPNASNFQLYTQKMGFPQSSDFVNVEAETVYALQNLKNNYVGFQGLTSSQISKEIEDTLEDVFRIKSVGGYRRCVRRALNAACAYIRGTGDEMGGRAMFVAGEYACWENHILGIH